MRGALVMGGGSLSEMVEDRNKTKLPAYHTYLQKNLPTAPRLPDTWYTAARTDSTAVLQ